MFVDDESPKTSVASFHSTVNIISDKLEAMAQNLEAMAKKVSPDEDQDSGH